MNDMTSESGPLIALPAGGDLEQMFRTENGLEAVIVAIEQRCKSEVFDYNTAAGRKAARSLAYRVAQSKTLIEETAKTINADMAAAIAKVNTEKKRSIERLEKVQADVKRPAEIWESREKDRKDRHMAALNGIASPGLGVKSTAQDLRNRIEVIEGLVIDESWEEFQDAANTRRGEELERLHAFLEVAEAREEAARLQAERAEREAQERAEREAREAKEREEREEAARIEREKQEAEARKAREEAEARAAEERAAREKAEAEAEAIRAKAAEEQAAKDAEIAELRRKLEDQQAEEARRSREAEEARQAEIRKAEEEAAEKARKEEAERQAEEERKRAEADAKAAAKVKAKQAAAADARVAEVRAEISAALVEAGGGLEVIPVEVVLDAMFAQKLPYVTLVFAM